MEIDLQQEITGPSNSVPIFEQEIVEELAPDIVTVKESEPIDNLNITISEDLIMPSESVSNEAEPVANSTTPEEEEDMLTSFFNGIFGSDNSTEPEAVPDEE